MAPRTEFVLLAALAGTVVATLGYVAASALVFNQTLAEALRLGATWSPSATLAAAGAAWLASMRQRRAALAGRHWRAPGMAARATLLSLLLYPPAVVLWVLVTGLFDQGFASGGMPLRELLPWVPSIVFGTALAAVLVGTLPAFALAVVLCRRYLRRLAGATTDIA
ncbi:hypothetical protein [Pseudoxanthomonas koreensis]|uniref:hypothetical protein n=1 Tax=Pseudoxanthomonas koreensis TaxID=266061 RepID=UPI0013919F2D|nr:hypothetical protein [Pseudoxanthomonas koreensis]KAF1690521.1 hypothetical protein CSC64_11185 [Pseudoxanthomonas koreensis]